VSAGVPAQETNIEQATASLAGRVDSSSRIDRRRGAKPPAQRAARTIACGDISHEPPLVAEVEVDVAPDGPVGRKPN
jgi:hypothetical protein